MLFNFIKQVNCQLCGSSQKINFDSLSWEGFDFQYEYYSTTSTDSEIACLNDEHKKVKCKVQV